MSLLVDETAGDLPVRDVGLMRGGLMPAVPGLVIHYSALKKESVEKLPSIRVKSVTELISLVCESQILSMMSNCGRSKS